MAQGLRTTDDSAGYDAACKRVLSEKAILARIMKACLAEYQDCPVRDIEEKYIEGQPQVSSVPVLPDEEGTMISGLDTEDKSVYEGTVTYDIRFRAIAPDSGELIGLIVNVEPQNDFYPGYPLAKRGIYYILLQPQLQPHDFLSVWPGVYGLSLREAQEGLFHLDLHETAEKAGEYHHPVSSDGGTSCRAGCGAGPELQPAVHRHAVPGRAGRRKLRRCAADAGCAALARNQRGRETQNFAGRL